MDVGRYLKPIRWDRDTEGALIQKLGMAAFRLKGSSETLAELSAAAAEHSPWEITLVLTRMAEREEIGNETAERCYAAVRDVMNARIRSEGFWPGFKSMLMADWDP